MISLCSVSILLYSVDWCQPFRLENTDRIWVVVCYHTIVYTMNSQYMCIHLCFLHMWRHLGNPGLLGSKLWFRISTFSMNLYSLTSFKLCRYWEKCLLQMLICDKKSRLWANVAQNARRLNRACSSISRDLSINITYRVLRKFENILFLCAIL